MRVIQPYEDEKMTFNQDLNMYVLKIAEVKDKLEDTIQDDGKLTKRITKNSRTVYNYIHAIGHSANKPFVDFLINRTEEGRKLIYEALLTQMEADLENGYNSLLNEPRIDLRSNQVIDEGAFVSSQVTIATRQILEGAPGTLGINILCQSQYPYGTRLYLRGLGA